LLSSEEFDGLLETLEILSSKAQVQRLVEADDELLTGGGHSLEEVRRELAGDRG
jgi:PHD/YefM family antitoxin component YafN of YafNO toxin-antitoxin module